MSRARYILADSFPPPTGPHGIGKRLLPPAGARDAPLTPQIHLFYPIDRPIAAGRSRHPDTSICNAPPAAAVLGAAPDSLPLVIYFSGWPGNATDNYALICELVSHGMTVATVIYPAAAGDMDYSSEAAYQRTVREANRLVEIRATDARALLDRLGAERAATLGFSFGGAVAAEAAVRDARFCAAVNIDGRPWGRALHEGVASRYLFLGGDRPMPSAADLTSSNPDRRYNAQLDVVDIQELSRNLARHGGIHVTVSKAEHLDFIDGALRWSRRRLLRLNPVDPRRVLHATRAYVGAFLRNAFGMQSSPLPGACLPGISVAVYPRPDGRSASDETRGEAAGDVRQQQGDRTRV